MKNIAKNLFTFAAAVSLLASCKPEKALTVPKPDKGQLDLTTYVAVGNSLTSGYQDNGLSYNGQKSSYVNVLAEQFKLVNPNLVFNTPFVSASSVGCGAPNVSFAPTPDLNNLLALLATTFTIDITVPAPYSLQVLPLPACKGGTGLTPAPKAPYGDGQIIFGPNFDNANGYHTTVAGAGLLTLNIPTAPSTYSVSGPFHNMGVPGARAIDVNKKGFGGSSLISVSGTTPSQSNPFFSRFAKDQANSSMLSDAMLLNPTFFSLFIGNNDVLLWASQGGVGNALLGTTITPAQEFNDSIDHIVTGLMKTAKQGVIINIAQITGAAFFTYNKANTSYWIIDENATARTMYSDELILLTVPQDSLQCQLGGFGTQAYPIPKRYTLTRNQVAQVTAAIDGYNAHLKAVADNNGLAFFDMNEFTKANQDGGEYNGMLLSGEFVTGGIFSLDGLHLTARGYAAMTHQLIKVINAKYKSTIPGPDVTKYDGVQFPE